MTAFVGYSVSENSRKKIIISDLALCFPIVCNQALNIKSGIMYKFVGYMYSAPDKINIKINK